MATTTTDGKKMFNPPGKACGLWRVRTADALHREAPNVRWFTVLDGARGHHGARYVSALSAVIPFPPPPPLRLFACEGGGAVTSRRVEVESMAESARKKLA